MATLENKQDKRLEQEKKTHRLTKKETFVRETELIIQYSPLGCPEEPIGLELAFPTLALWAFSLKTFSDLF